MKAIFIIDLPLSEWSTTLSCGVKDEFAGLLLASPSWLQITHKSPELAKSTNGVGEDREEKKLLSYDYLWTMFQDMGLSDGNEESEENQTVGIADVSMGSVGSYSELAIGDVSMASNGGSLEVGPGNKRKAQNPSQRVQPLKKKIRLSVPSITYRKRWLSRRARMRRLARRLWVSRRP